MKPLNIAFFGSDAFSVHLLSRLVSYAKANPSTVSNIDVITRSIKPTGRRLTTYVESPIGVFSKANNIKIIRADSKSDIINLTNDHYHLSIAVSYGCLIPHQFLSKCTYGGWNVHPSLLPKYSGSSPIQYALMNDDKETGVTLQTLHPTKFDHGDIILQSGTVPIAPSDTYPQLVDKLGTIGGQLLVKAIDEQLYTSKQFVSPMYPFSLAPKIKPSQRLVDWPTMTTNQIKRLQDALGPIYTYIPVSLTRKGKTINTNYKVFLEHISPLKDGSDIDMPVGGFKLSDNDNKLIVKTIDGAIQMSSVKVETYGSETPKAFIHSLKKKTGSNQSKFFTT